MRHRPAPIISLLIAATAALAASAYAASAYATPVARFHGESRAPSTSPPSPPRLDVRLTLLLLFIKHG